MAQTVGPEPAAVPGMVLPAIPFPPSPPALEGVNEPPSAGADTGSAGATDDTAGTGVEQIAAPVPKTDDTPLQRKTAAPTARDICQLIGKDAEAVGMPKDFFARLIWKESRFDIKAVSPVGAQGIAQFMPYTAVERGLDDPYDLESSIRHSAQYLADLRTELGNWGLAAAAYNGGINRVKSWIANGGYLPAETENYVAAITFRPADWFKEDGREVEHHPLDDELEFLDGCAQLPIMKTRSVFGSLADVDSAPMKPWGVQVAGNERQAVAMRMFARVQSAFPSILGDIKPIVTRTRTSPRRRIYAVRIGADTKSEADALCNRLRGAGGFCIVMKN
ncbi:lytic transglycosylase domain-containing protein [Aurantimonas sp. VKM B-3413]|uniref:lytic transglycosylase domain-containing protein n=1 Tax=Aurantimonas sp. VKM B-3413 TaxID=2779401 RepID=UPI001E61434B|nr:lytic transglycosylase domain-containing protein [Aurantimonas sp. VKM B-3413]